MTKPTLEYIRKRIHAGNIPEEQFGIYEIIIELSRRADCYARA